MINVCVGGGEGVLGGGSERRGVPGRWWWIVSVCVFFFRVVWRKLPKMKRSWGGGGARRVTSWLPQRGRAVGFFFLCFCISFSSIRLPL